MGMGRTVIEPGPDYEIRFYRASDVVCLSDVEKRAARLFAAHGYPDIAEAPATRAEDFCALASQNRIFVAAHELDGPAGFAIVGTVFSFLHILELSVAPEHGRRGLGGALLGAVIAESRARGFEGVSLSTFRTVPFNGPFYARHGFLELPLEEAPEALKKRFFAEIPPGVAPQSRVLMLRRNTKNPA